MDPKTKRVFTTVIAPILSMSIISGIFRAILAVVFPGRTDKQFICFCVVNVAFAHVFGIVGYSVRSSIEKRKSASNIIAPPHP
jgi:hypothetical protein